MIHIHAVSAAVLILLTSSAAAQNALGELRAAAGPAALSDSRDIPAGVPVRHSGRDDGREAAAQACVRLTGSDRQACRRSVDGARYFDVGAVSVCRGVSLDSDAAECIAVIADKTYLRGEIVSCGEESFGSEIVDCFRNAGRPHEGADDRVVAELRRIARLLRGGFISEGIRALDDLIAVLDAGPH